MDRTERTYNAICPTTARRLATDLRERGYEVKRDEQWVYVMAESLDMQVQRIASLFQAIAY